MTTYQDQPLSRRALRDGQRDQESPVAPPEPLTYVTQSRPPLPAYEGPRFRAEPTPEGADDALPPTQALPRQDGFRLRDFSPEGRRSAAPSWGPAAGAGAVSADGNITYQTQARAQVPVPERDTVQRPAAPVAPSVVQRSADPGEFTLTRRELRAMREAQGLAPRPTAEAAPAPGVIDSILPAAAPTAPGTPLAAPSSRLDSALAEFDALAGRAGRRAATDQPPVPAPITSLFPAASAPAAPAFPVVTPAPAAQAPVAPAPIAPSAPAPVAAPVEVAPAASAPVPLVEPAPQWSAAAPEAPVAPVEREPVVKASRPSAFDLFRGRRGAAQPATPAPEPVVEPEAPAAGGLSAFDALFTPPSVRESRPAEAAPSAPAFTAPAVPAPEILVTPVVAPPAPVAAPPVVPVAVEPVAPVAPTPEITRPAMSAPVVSAPITSAPITSVPPIDLPATPAPSGHWSQQAELADETAADVVLGRSVGGGVITTNALVLPSIPNAASLTSEIMITGSIDLPHSLSQTGAHPDQLDESDLDHLLDPGDRQLSSPSSQPVRAIRAVSTHTSQRNVIAGAKPKGNKGLTVLIVAASVMAAVVVTLLVVGLATGHL